MAKIDALPGLDIINGFKGTIDFYVYRGQPCARRWPRSPGPRRAPAVMETALIFADAIKLYNEIEPEVRQAYINMAAGTNYTGRDLFTMGYISGIPELT